MLKLVVCIKQIPRVTELPWDEKTGTLRRDLAAGMMNPACKHALEAALQIKETLSAKITVITMGPPSAEEILREALALGADEAILICDRLLAGSDTFATSLILKEAIQKKCPKFDLILCGAYTADSETAQVGPQLAEELDLPAAAYVEKLEIEGRTLRVRRLVDNFRETLEMEFPALVTISMENYKPRYTGLAGLENAFEENDIAVLDAKSLGFNAASIETKGSRTKVRKVFLRKAPKGNVILQGAASHVVNEFLDKYQRKIGTVIGKSIEEKNLNDKK
ncbi:MAG TPA: electron transfer flavoprotein subunit beta/FixA family protein [Smithella sp.]|nr:electron transfer flavoprotein subunit beta/FixA family protein [Smithella sp.]HNY49947.1 electron transfer flavoprotein subunit beta/FixA family protein [Smithella sp.]HOG90475.1 electron transfer flavoprotein subunit beta/FixA family protein [Smithella sp.]HQI71987.1 electron transfer flavoprotein subunit beta/FixA family protein [Smithella sp.]HQO14536.1 electron transfer flavoprotein subunit beta/FixA family protein [Smithellaceae bacterium]